MSEHALLKEFNDAMNLLIRIAAKLGPIIQRSTEAEAELAEAKTALYNAGYSLCDNTGQWARVYYHHATRDDPNDKDGEVCSGCGQYRIADKCQAREEEAEDE